MTPEGVGRLVQGNLKTLAGGACRLVPLGRDYEILRSKLKENLTALDLSPELESMVERDARALDSQIQWTRNVRQAIAAIGFGRDRGTEMMQAMLKSSESSRCEAASACRRTTEAFQEAWREYARHAGTTPATNDSDSLAADATAQAQRVLSERTSLKQLTAWTAMRLRAEQAGLSAFIEALETGSLKSADAAEAFELAYARWWLPTIVDKRQPIRDFQKIRHEEAIEKFCRLDDRARQLAAPQACRAVLHGLPPSDQVSRKSELGLLRHQLGLKRPSRSIREMIAGMPETFGKLAPCLLMSPLSIAQYLPADQAQFDVVVFDEASQIATWDAIGAIARGRQTIIVGDPKQLPPTNFFGRADSDENHPELADYEKDLESILDEAQASGLPTLQLNWHYRSRHESLIAFSNWKYYGNRLVTFPGAESTDRGVRLRHVHDAVYDRGKSRTNRKEAEAIVGDTVERMKRCLRKPEEQRLTYGVVTFNASQQELIQDLFDAAQRQNPELEWFFSDDRIEPAAVKNLENVQGDERDVMMFSITFGFDAVGKFPVDFGAINREGGERRLNVAITRARQELVVYTSFLPDQLRVARSTARGIHDLKAFLEYAEKGPAAIFAQNKGSVGDHESPLETAVAAALAERGWQIDPQVGVSGFRIDLGIVHPDKPGAYLAGVECDGATYHRSAVARDRDKTRQQVLENLGWAILRVWSTDWWYAPERAITQLDSSLTQLLQRDREKKTDAEPLAVPEKPGTGAGCEQAPQLEESGFCSDIAVSTSLDTRTEMSHEDPGEPAACPPVMARQIPQADRRIYSRADLGDATSNQARFYEDSYSDTLRGMALAVLETQGPIRDDALAREIARAHGFARTGNRIRQRVLELLPDVIVTEEPVGKFLWPGPASQDSIPFRYPADEGERRSLDEIAMPELVGLVNEFPSLTEYDDPALVLAREIGLARLARAARERLEEALLACEIDP